MRSIITLTLILVFLSVLLSGCGFATKRESFKVAPHAENGNSSTSVAADTQPDANAQVREQTKKPATAKADPHEAIMQPVSLQQADQNQSIAAAVERKIIKDGEFTLEVDSPTDAERKASSIAERHGGFVVNSESKQRQSPEPSQRLLDITLVMRIPSNQFDAVIGEIYGLSKTVLDKKTTGQDVTEEFIDLEARVKTQKALEAQFLEIMKQAHKVEDALEVQRQIAEVRSEIEKIEGRKRFLENRSSLSTITLNLQSPHSTTIVTTTGFGNDVKQAFKDSVNVGVAIVLFLIRFVIVMVPIFILIILPGGIIVRYFVRRARRLRPPRLAPDDKTPIPSV